MVTAWCPRAGPGRQFEAKVRTLIVSIGYMPQCSAVPASAPARKCTGLIPMESSISISMVEEQGRVRPQGLHKGMRLRLGPGSFSSVFCSDVSPSRTSIVIQYLLARTNSVKMSQDHVPRRSHEIDPDELPPSKRPKLSENSDADVIHSTYQTSFSMRTLHSCLLFLP